MTTLETDPDTYYAASSRCTDAAVQLHTAFAAAVQTLRQCGSMAGTYDAGREWATSYDDRAGIILTTFDDAIRALENYADVLRQAGHNYALAEHNANIDAGAPPAPPPLPSVVPGCSPTFPPSAGGPGNGLIDDMLGLTAEIGITVPDGDTSKLELASAAWNHLATGGELAAAADALDSAIDQFADLSSPDIDFIFDDLDELRSAVDGLQSACSEVAHSCSEYKTNIDDFRRQLTDLLEGLALELAVTATIAIAASFVSFGLSAAVGAAKSAQTVGKFARMARDAIAAWKLGRGIGRGVVASNDLTGLRLVLERLKSLGKKIIDQAKLNPPKRNIDDLFRNGNRPKASELEEYARSEGWTRTQTADGPPKYVDENGVVRMTIKKGSPRAPGSADPHVELRDPSGQRVDPFGNPVTRKSTGNHTPIEWDLP